LNAASWSPDSRSKAYINQIEAKDINLEAKTVYLMLAMSNAVSPETCREAMISLLRNIDFVNMLKTNEELAFASLIWASKIAAKYSDPALSSHVESTIRSITQNKMIQHGYGLLVERGYLLIFEPVFCLALGAGELDAYLQRLMQLLNDLVDIDHNLIPHALTILEKHAEQLPFEKTREVWRMIMILRSYTFKKN